MLGAGVHYFDLDTPRFNDDPRKSLPVREFWIRLGHDSRRLSFGGRTGGPYRACAERACGASGRANAVLLLDKGWNCERVADALFLDDDRFQQWHDLFAATGVEGLSRFEFGGGSGFLREAQEAGLKAWIVRTLPRTSRIIGAYVAREFGVVYESRSGLVKLLHRLGVEFQKLEVIGRRLDEGKQRALIAAYENLFNSLGPDEAGLFVDAVHPTHAARPVGCWTAAQDKLVIE